MNTSSSNKWWLYAGTLVIELITGVFRLLFTIPLVMLILIIVEFLLGKMGIQLFDAYRSVTDLQYSQRLLWFIFITAAMLAYANIIASLFAAAGFGGGSLMTRFVLGAREPSTRERETILAVFEQMAEGVEEPIQSYSKLYVIDAVLEFANLVGTTLYVSSAAFRGSNLQALVAHEFGHLNNGDGSLILALRRLVFPPFSLFIGGIRDFSTNRPAYRPGVKEFDAVQIFYSMINNIIFFTLAFIGGGLGVWVMSWAWARYFRARDYLADSFAAGLGYRDLLLRYLEANIYFDTSVPYMLGWHPAAELRIDALQHPELYGLPSYEGVTAAEEADAGFTPLADVEPAGEGIAPPLRADDSGLPSGHTARNFAAIAIVAILGYLLMRTWPDMQPRIGEILDGLTPDPTAQATEPDPEGESVDEAPPPAEATETPATVVAGLRNCPLEGETGNNEGLNWAISVPEGEVAFINAQEFDELTSGVFVTVNGPYEQAHWVKDAGYCGGIPADADYAWLQQQRRNLLSIGYQELMFQGTVLASSCSYSQEWFTEIQATTTDIPGLLGALDDEFNRTGNPACSGAWSGPGFTIPANSVFWTDLYEDRYNSPAPTPVRAEGGWGVFHTSEPFTISSTSNTGGRYLVLDAPADEAADCTTIVSASRELEQRGFGEQCWLKLVDGAAAEIEFNDEAQVTYRTTLGGNDVYFDAVSAGERLTDVVGATIRPLPFVQYQYGGLEEVKNFEIQYHSPGGTWATCLWDAGNDQALNDECGEEGTDETTLDSLLAPDIVAQIKLLGYPTASEFATAWGLRIGPDKTNGEVDPSEISTCPGETNGCVSITRETNASGAVEWAFYARNPNNCRQDGYRREPGQGGQTGVPPNFEGLLEGATIRRCQEATTTEVISEEPAPSGGQDCKGTQLGPLVQADHTFDAPVIVLQLWRMNGDSPWGSGEVMTVVQGGVTIRGTGGNAWSYPAAECLNVATIEMQGGANLRGSTVVTPEDLRAAGMID